MLVYAYNAGSLFCIHPIENRYSRGQGHIYMEIAGKYIISQLKILLKYLLASVPMYIWGFFSLYFQIIVYLHFLKKKYGASAISSNSDVLK